MLTAFLSRVDVARNMQALHLLRELRDAFAKHDSRGEVTTTRESVASASTDLRIGALPGSPAFSVMVRTEALGEPPQAVLQLHEVPSGKLLAVMNATHLAALRNALVGALATDVLAREQAADVAVLGSGAAASGALKALRLVRSIDRVWLHQPDESANFELAMKLHTSMAMAVRPVDSAQRAVADADVVLLTGGVTLPVASLRTGTHVTILSAETFSGAPVSDPVLAGARRFRDARTPELAWGQPSHALLGEVLSGAQPGRISRDDITLFASVSPPFLDLVAALHVFEGAQRDETLTRLDLEV